MVPRRRPSSALTLWRLKVLHDSRRSNDSQFERLAGAIYEILQHINDLPDALAARLSTDPTPFLPPEMLSSEVAHHTPTHDREQHSDTASTLVDHLEAQADAAQQHQTGNRVRFEDQPRNSFVQLERSSSAAETQNKGSTLKRKGSLSKLGSVLRGPRMPGGIKIWSACRAAISSRRFEPNSVSQAQVVRHSEPRLPSMQLAGEASGVARREPPPARRALLILTMFTYRSMGQ